MTETKKENRGILIGLVLGIIAILILGGLIKYGVDEPIKEINYKQKYQQIQAAMELNYKQFAYQRAMWEKEVVLSDQRDRDQQAQIIALQERSNKQTIQYKQTIEKIKQEAPKPCEPYITQIADECNKVIEAKDDVIEAQRLRNDSLYKDKMAALGFIKVQADYIAKDSIADVGKDAIMDGLLKENKKLARKAKRGKIVSWLIGLGLGALWLGTSLID